MFSNTYDNTKVNKYDMDNKYRNTIIWLNLLNECIDKKEMMDIKRCLTFIRSHILTI